MVLNLSPQLSLEALPPPDVDLQPREEMTLSNLKIHFNRKESLSKQALSGFDGWSLGLEQAQLIGARPAKADRRLGAIPVD